MLALCIVLVVLMTDTSYSVKIQRECSTYIRRLIVMWLENPCIIPNRLSGSAINWADETTTTSKFVVPDVLLWDPITQFKIHLGCPLCQKIAATNELHATRCKDGSSPQDHPRQLFCIQKHVLLVSRVYRWPVGHQILAHDQWLLRITSSQVPCEIPFVLIHQSGVTQDLFLYIFTHVQSGVKLIDIERLLAQMYNDGVHNIRCRLKQHKYVINKLETPGRQITTSCFVWAYFEFEHMYAQDMSQIFPVVICWPYF